MKKIVYLSTLFLMFNLFFAQESFTQKKDNTLYFKKYHEDTGRKGSLRRMGPGEKYRTPLGSSDLGSAVITPNEDVIAGSFGTWKIIYTVGKEGLNVNDAINIYIPYGFGPPFLHYPTFPVYLKRKYGIERITGLLSGLTTVSTTNPHTKLILYSNIYDHAKLSEGHKIYIGIRDEPLREGDKIIINYGETKYGGAGASAPCFAQDFEFTIFVFKNVDWNRFEDMVNNIDKKHPGFTGTAEEIYCIQNPPALHVIGGKAVELAFTVPSIASVNEPFDLHILAKDRLVNESEDYTGTTTFESSDIIEIPGAYRFCKPNNGFARIDGGGRISKTGVYRLIVRDEENSFVAESNPIKIVSATGSKKLYWGDLHIHSFESDGIGSPDHNNKFAKDIAALDFCCISDHASGVFRTIRESAVRFTEPGKFLSFSGFEGYIADGGDINFYFIDDSPEYEKILKKRMPINVEYRKKYNSKRELWTKLHNFSEKKIIVIPHNHNR